MLRIWAPNCCTFSRARERPIPGAIYSPKPLRSIEFPEGVPEVLDSLPVSKRRKLDLDTHMADLAAESCISAHREGRHFSLEHPRNSLARGLVSWQKLERMSGVQTTSYHACMFHPCKRRKSQVLIHNIPGLERFVGLECRSSRLCSRTGSAHSWQPTIENGKVTSFPTSEEREYPEGFCTSCARGINKALGKKGATFLEIFSGPNAPLSHAVAREWNTKVEGEEGGPLFSNFEHSEASTLTVSANKLQCPEANAGGGSKLLQSRETKLASSSFGSLQGPGPLKPDPPCNPSKVRIGGKRPKQGVSLALGSESSLFQMGYMTQKHTWRLPRLSHTHLTRCAH